MYEPSIIDEIVAGHPPEDLDSSPQGTGPRQPPWAIPEPPAELARLVERLVFLRRDERKALRKVARAERRAHLLEAALGSVDEAITSFLRDELKLADRIDPETNFSPALVIGGHAVVLQKPGGGREHWMTWVLPISHMGPAVDMK
jgi:hypothetical protein